MCSCEPGFLCPRCAGTPDDPGYLFEPDPREAEHDRFEAGRAGLCEAERALGLVARC